MQASNFGGTFDQLFLRIFYKIFTEDASLPLLYHGAKKSKMTKNSNQGGPALRPEGGVKHPDSDLVETGMLSAKKALRWIEGSILSNSRKFEDGGWWFSHFNWAKCAENTRFPLASN